MSTGNAFTCPILLVVVTSPTPTSTLTEDTTFLSMVSLLWKVIFICTTCSKYCINLLVTLQQSTVTCMQQTSELLRWFWGLRVKTKLLVCSKASPGLVDECCFPPTFPYALLFGSVFSFIQKEPNST